MFQNTKEGAKQDAKNATSRALNNQDVQDVVHDATEFANRTGRKLRGYYNAATDELSDDYEYVTTRIRNNPVQASLVALGAGVILGALFRRL